MTDNTNNHDKALGSDFDTDDLVRSAQLTRKQGFKNSVQEAKVALNKALVEERVQELKVDQELLRLEELRSVVMDAKASLKAVKKDYRRFKSAPKKKIAVATVGTVATMAAAAVVANRLGLLGDDEK